MVHDVLNKLNSAILALSAGERSAMSDIYDIMAKKILSVGYVITGNYADAEDILQETLIEIIRSASSYKPNTNAHAWILSIARHRSIDFLRKKEPVIFSEEMPDSAQICDDLNNIEVNDMLKILNSDEKQIVLFRLYMNMPYSEISKIMQINIFAAQKKFQRAVKKLKTFYI